MDDKHINDKYKICKKCGLEFELQGSQPKCKNNFPNVYSLNYLRFKKKWDKLSRLS